MFVGVLQIVRLAADGLSNREISQQLCLSHRAVRTHLDEILPKLGITSRGQLQAALAGSPYLTGVPLARSRRRDSLGGPDRYGAWLLSVTAAGGGADEPADDCTGL